MLSIILKAKKVSIKYWHNVGGNDTIYECVWRCMYMCACRCIILFCIDVRTIGDAKTKNEYGSIISVLLLNINAISKKKRSEVASRDDYSCILFNCISYFILLNVISFLHNLVFLIPHRRFHSTSVVRNNKIMQTYFFSFYIFEYF